MSQPCGLRETDRKLGEWLAFLAFIGGVNDVTVCFTAGAMESPVLEQRSRFWMFIKRLLMGMGPSRCWVGFRLMTGAGCTEITGPSKVIV